ncbi:MAG: hypothetical protein EXR68_07260, partial [Dehalococcoidia bacterium]|nr:hypothetical protein [Dehalococcoidia bacterium]
MTERWFREDARSNVEVYADAVPPALDQLLNSGVTNPADRVSLPIHLQAKLLGSSYMHQADGTDLVWMMYDVDGDIRIVAQAVAGQIDASPWQVTAGLGEEITRVLRFQNSRIADLDGSAIVRLNPNADGYLLTVTRSGKGTTLDVKLTAPPVDRCANTTRPDGRTRRSRIRARGGAADGRQDRPRERHRREEPAVAGCR